jgi:hypothetical protein
VRVSLIGAAYSEEFAALLQEWLRIQNLEAEIRPQRQVVLEDLLEADDTSAVRVWLMLRTSRQARLYFADQQARRFHVRDVPLDNALDELGREKVAQVVLASVLAFVEHGLTDTPLESVKRALAEPAPEPGAESEPEASAVGLASSTASETPPERSESLSAAAPAVKNDSSSREDARWWALALRYHVLYRGPEGWAHGPGFDVELWPILRHFGLGVVVGGRYEWPHAEASEHLSLRLQTTSLRAALVLATIVGSHPRWSLSMGAGWDWYRFEPESSTPEVTASGGGADTRIVASLAAGHAVSFGKLRLDLALGVELPLEKTHYDLLVEGDPHRELSPWPVQPHGALGFAWQ